MYRVTKRDGSITEFHIAKIGNAITRAFEAVGRQIEQGASDVARSLSRRSGMS